MKYAIIETWNGDGYSSENLASIKDFDNDSEAQKYLESLVHFQTPAKIIESSLGCITYEKNGDDGTFTFIRNAEKLGFAGIEKTIGDYGKKARDGKLTMADLTGGTFTISNGGVYGSLLSTPIINPPQSAILGMHKTQERPVAINGKVEIRPMMYLALSYDHRIIDGKEAVTFLVKVKECIENPERLLFDL